MADISKITVNSTEYDIKDATARNDLLEKANTSGDTFTGTVTFNKSIRQIITGTGTAGTTGSSSVAYVPSKWTFDLGMTPAAGDIITIRIPVIGVNSGVWLSVDNGTTYYPVAAGAQTRLTTHFGVGYTISLIYQTGMTTAIYGTTVAGAVKGASTTNVTLDRWCVLNFYDTNTTYSAMSASEMNTGTATSSRVMTAKNLKAGMEAILKATDGDVQLYGAHLTGQVPAPTAADNGKILKIADGLYSLADDANTDTKNTAGSTDTSSKIFLIGATTQAANPQTYSHDTAYVGTDGCLYSGGVKVLTAHQDISGKVSGPSSATANHIATFDGTTGKVINDSGYTIATSVPANAVFTDTVPSYSYDSINQVLTISYPGDLQRALDRNF